MDFRKKIFFGLLVLVGISLGFRGDRFLPPSDFFPYPGSSQDSETQYREPTRFVPVVALYPILSESRNLFPLGRGVEDFWRAWIIQSPSLVLSDSPKHLARIKGKELRFRLKRFSSLRGADFVFTGELEDKEGKIFLRSYVYSRSDDLLLHTGVLEIKEGLLSQKIQESYNMLIQLTERHLHQTGIRYSIDKGKYFQELYLPSIDTTARYFSYLEAYFSGTSTAGNRQNINEPGKESPKTYKVPMPEPSVSDWEDLSGREELFWNPWEYYIRLKYKNKEDSYEAKYYLDSFARRSVVYFQPHIARLAMDFGEIALQKNEKYRVMGFLDLAEDLFQASYQTQSLDYSKNLYLKGLYYFRENNMDLARLHLLNSQKILVALNQKTNPIYLETKFLLSKVFKKSGQGPIAIWELEEALDLVLHGLGDESSEYSEFLAVSYYNLGTLNLEMGRYQESERYLLSAIEILKKKNQLYEDLLFYSMINLGSAVLGQKRLNEFIDMALKLDQDLHILGMEKSLFSGHNLYNLALAFRKKGAVSTSNDFLKSYKSITAYSSQKSLGDFSLPLYFPIRIQSQAPTEDWIFSKREKDLIQSFTGKFSMANHAKEIRSRTYTDRLEDHDIFLQELLGDAKPTSSEMVNLRKILGIGSQHRKGEDVLFVDIGPAIANQNHPAVTTISMMENFPNMDTVILDLPSEVNIFLKETKPELRQELLSFGNLRILSGDGTRRLSELFRKEGAWILKDRTIPILKNRLIVIRAANSIDVYEPFSRIKPFLEYLSQDFKEENLVLIFNRLLIVKPKNETDFRVIGSQSIRGFYHNLRSLDRQGQLPFVLSNTVLGEETVWTD